GAIGLGRVAKSAGSGTAAGKTEEQPAPPSESTPGLNDRLPLHGYHPSRSATTDATGPPLSVSVAAGSLARWSLARDAQAPPGSDHPAGSGWSSARRRWVTHSPAYIPSVQQHPQPRLGDRAVCRP